MTIPANQLAMIDPGAHVAIRIEGETWDATLGHIGEPDQEGSAVAQIVPVKGERSVCGTQCDLVPISGGSLPAEVIVVPRTTGTIVPAAALVVADDGSVAVVTEDGEQIGVEVTASAAGQAVVTGVDVGIGVRVPGDSASTAGPS